MELTGLQEQLGYQFKNEDLLIQSLTHPSYRIYSGHEERSNQRLEFLGDAVLDLVISEFLYLKFTDLREGQLTKLRSTLVNGSILFELAAQFGLSKHIRVNQTSADDSPRALPSTQEDALEALIGAIYLDSGYSTTKEVVLNWFATVTERLGELNENHNPKGRLQELLQPKIGNNQIRYNVVNESGPSHDPEFEVELNIGSNSYSRGLGKSKKEAEENAAREVLENFETFEFPHA